MIEFFDVEGDFPRPVEADPARRAGKLTVEALAASAIPPGGRVAVAVGSRGIKNIPQIVRAVVTAIKEGGFSPFVVPAMGSHGGDDAVGQKKTLASLGITEESAGAEIVSRPETVLVGKTPGGAEIFIDAAAWTADAIIPINRVKPHTAFRGAVESGPAKMLTVGLGKAKSASSMHRAGLATAIPSALEVLLGTGKIPFGIAILENGHGETAKVATVMKDSWISDESALLREAWELYPRLPWDEFDILIVEKIGKDISGTGMDINIIGMDRRYPGTGAKPVIGRVIALDLSPKSAGNATGVGYADIITEKLGDSADWAATRLNCETSGFHEAARMPFVAKNEAAAVSKALSDLSKTETAVAAVRIPDTSRLTKIKVSRALLERLPPHFHRA